MNALISYLKHVREEFTHIVWPTRHTAIAHTLVVIFIAAVIALLVGLLDYGFGSIVNHILLADNIFFMEENEKRERESGIRFMRTRDMRTRLSAI